MFIIFYIVTVLKIFFVACLYYFAIMLMLVCLKDLFQAATGSCTIKGTSSSQALKGGSGFRCDLLSFWDDRSEHGSKRQSQTGSGHAAGGRLHFLMNPGGLQLFYF